MPDVIGDPELSLHLVESLVDEGFDLTVFQELDVDHGLTVPLSVWTPGPRATPGPARSIPLLVNVIQYPQPTAARCYALGQALGRAIRQLPGGRHGRRPRHRRHVAPARRRPGGVHQPEFDHMWMEAIQTDPAKLAALSREELIRQAGSEGIELIMWLIMRGAMNDPIDEGALGLLRAGVEHRGRHRAVRQPGPAARLRPATTRRPPDDPSGGLLRGAGQRAR